MPLRRLSRHVLVHQSEYAQTNSVVVRGAHNTCLLIDPGVRAGDLEEIVADLAAFDQGLTVVAGVCTHGHWDHVLWHPLFGDVPRYASADAIEDAERTRAQGLVEAQAAGALATPELAELLGRPLVPLTSSTVPWDGPRVVPVPHSAHAPGHLALYVEGDRVLLAGDMLSDIEVPLPDLAAADPVGDYERGLNVLAGVLAEGAEIVVPGHGSVATTPVEAAERLRRDRRYLAEVTRPRGPRGGNDARLVRRSRTDWLWTQHQLLVDWPAVPPSPKAT